MPEPALPPLIRRLITVVVTVAAAGFGFHQLFRGQHLFDLRIYISAEKWWLSGHELYDFAQADALQGRLSFTYPPFAALLMSPLGVLPQTASFVLLTAGTLAAVAATTWWVIAWPGRWSEASQAGPGQNRPAGPGRWSEASQAGPGQSRPAGLARRIPTPRWYAWSLALPLVLLIEPIRATLSFGQINMFLVLLILLDLLVLLPRGSRWAGVGIGIAAAIKLTPALFIVYLLLSRRTRAAVTAAGTAIGATLLAALIAPNATRDYWFSALWDTARVGRTDYTANQSLNGLLSRLSSPEPPHAVLWIGLAVGVAVVGLWRATIAVRAGDEITGVALTGLTAGLVSPITWVHHMYWFVPAIVALVAAAMTGPGSAATAGSRRMWLLVSAAAAYAITVVGVDTVVDWGVAQRPTPSVREFLLRNAFVLLSLALVFLLPVPLARRTPASQPASKDGERTPIEVVPERGDDRPHNGPIVRSVADG